MPTKLIIFCLLCFAAISAFPQHIMLSTEKGELYVVDMTNCTPQKQDYATGWHIGSMAMYRSTFYYFNTEDNRLYSVTGNPGNRVQKKEESVNGIAWPVTAMTADKIGRLYWINPDNLTQTYLPGERFSGGGGIYRFKIAGDVVWYKEKYYVSTEMGIAKLNYGWVPDEVIIPTTRVFAGLVNIASTCGGPNKVYGIENVGSNINIVEIDIDHQKILDTHCSLDLGSRVVDAASPNETGETNYIGVNYILSERSCFPDTTREVKINAFTPAGDSGLSYTFSKGMETMGPFKQPIGPFIFNGSTTPGEWKVRITSSDGCSLDTTMTLYPLSKITAVAVTRPDTCNLGNGSVTINTTGGAAPYIFTTESTLAQVSPIFTGLAQGSYKIKVTDSALCSVDVPFTIDPFNQPRPVLDIAITPSTKCTPGGEIKLIYPSLVPIPPARLDNDSFQIKNIFSKISAGPHRLQVKNGGCVFDTTIEVPLTTALPIAVDSIVTHNTCAGNGNIKLVISGAESPYHFEVNGKQYNSGATTANFPSGNYSAAIYNVANCTVKTIPFTIREKVNCDTIQAIFIPSAFTPNGDGKNDILKPRNNSAGKVVSFVFRVYNRSGQVMFESSSLNRGWDGNYKGIQQSTGTYVWMFEGKGSDGKVSVWNGTVVLIR